jgi:hypothetical protein
MAKSSTAEIEGASEAEIGIDPIMSESIDWSTQIDLDLAGGGSSKVKYYKTYFYYSGSIIDQDKFALQGYQENFSWADHANTYATVVTEYESVTSYEEVGRIDNRTYTYDEEGESQVELTTDTVYDWVTTEQTPVVTTEAKTETLYVVPSGVGIIAETNEASENLALSEYKDAYTHEEAFTDNSSMTHKYEAFTRMADGAHGFDDESDTSGEHVTSTISNEEANFIADIFVGSSGDLSDFSQSILDTITLDIYNTTLSSHNIYNIGSETKIKHADLREISAIESSFSASVDQNLVGYVS